MKRIRGNKTLDQFFGASKLSKKYEGKYHKYEYKYQSIKVLYLLLH